MSATVRDSRVCMCASYRNERSSLSTRSSDVLMNLDLRTTLEMCAIGTLAPILPRSAHAGIDGSGVSRTQNGCTSDTKRSQTGAMK